MYLELGENDDDAAAVAAFHDWARDLGYKVSLRPDGKVVGIRGRYGFDIHFRNGQGMKRLIMRCYFPSNPDRDDMPGRFALANKINSSFNIGTFWFDADADFA
ncbi:MAG: YbjN domain-containing protein, partial [Opitutales bacterium]|nr:YbjN domain-containing protein [Opitutales bacterium]